MVDLPEVSRLVDSAIRRQESKRKGDQRKHSFLEKKKTLHEHPKILHNLMDHAMKQ